jgi:hypothetical protein
MAQPKSKDEILKPYLIIVGERSLVDFNDALKAMQAYHDQFKPETSSDERFELFWKLYDHKIGRKNTMKEWKKLSEADIKLVLAHCEMFRAYKPWETYTHPWPERYLKHRRFEDELPKEFVDAYNKKKRAAQNNDAWVIK